MMEQRTSAARQADDEHGLSDVLAGNRWMTYPICLQPQARDQEPDQVASGDDPTQQGKVCLGLESSQQQPKRLAEVVIAEVLELGGLAGGAEQALLRQRDGGDSRTLEPRPCGIRRTHTRAN